MGLVVPARWPGRITPVNAYVLSCARCVCASVPQGAAASFLRRPAEPGWHSQVCRAAAPILARDRDGPYAITDSAPLARVPFARAVALRLHGLGAGVALTGPS